MPPVHGLRSWPGSISVGGGETSLLDSARPATFPIFDNREFLVTRSDFTAIQMLGDRSGSMADIQKDAEGGIRTFIDDQRKVPGKCTLRYSQFDTLYEVVYPSTPIESAPYPTIKPRGGTALLDAWGRAIVEFGEELAALPEDERPGQVIFVVVTDGEENSSIEWDRNRLFEEVKKQTDQFGWTFLFLAANQDAAAEGAKYGVSANHSLDFNPTGQSVNSSYAAASASVTRTRKGAGVGFTAEEKSAASSS